MRGKCGHVLFPHTAVGLFALSDGSGFVPCLQAVCLAPFLSASFPSSFRVVDFTKKGKPTTGKGSKKEEKKSFETPRKSPAATPASGKASGKKAGIEKQTTLSPLKTPKKTPSKPEVRFVSCRELSISELLLCCLYTQSLIQLPDTSSTGPV